ncbi:LuxR family transcriptional regulator [Gordonia amarae]|uniref:LuxR family transcriptional regulator n=2 Tax=Gordonia amarae TaxID=36821 RepID=A0A857LTK9_9ACTN|nr:LuxR family transcriptional regulator [Gordonia amarae]QHN24078.1 LuxR family transcriptional regulator [Gordonia amarae]QHN32994.1 LuxR family transcriptional regulator [Gordonia amarae]QHN41715.1 LuxR family transcriptional regulator [Gordonia amarae]
MTGPAPVAAGPVPRPGLATPRLSAREVEILSTWLVCDTKVEVAERLFVTVATVRTHLARIRSKYRDAGRPAGTKIALLIRAVEDGYCTLDDIACKLDFGAQEDDDDLVTTPVVSVVR